MVRGAGIDDEQGQLYVIDAAETMKLDRTIALTVSTVLPYTMTVASAAGANAADLLLLTSDGLPTQWNVVDLTTHESVAGHYVPGTYDPAAVAWDGTAFYMPSAYPDEIVTFEPDADDGLTETGRIAVSGWIHDVKLIDDATALVAGHLSGITIVGLDGADEGSIVSDLKVAYLLMADGRTYAAAGPYVEEIALDSLAVRRHQLHQDEVGFHWGRTSVPFVELEAGSILVHATGTGVWRVHFD